MKFILTYIVFICAFCNISRAELIFENYVIGERIYSSSPEFKFAFDFLNDSEKNVKITKIATSCGCTASVADKNEYAPNESGQIRGAFKTEGKRGKQKVDVVVFTDDISAPQIKLSLDLEIVDPVRVMPRLAIWQKDSEPSEKTVSIETEDGVKVSLVENDDGNYSARMEELPNSKYALHITPVQTSKPFKGIVELKSESPRHGQKAYLVHVMVK